MAIPLISPTPNTPKGWLRFAAKRSAQAVALAMLLQSGPAAALGLMQAYEAALQNDPTFRTAFYESEAGKENEALGRSNLLPSIAFNYSKAKNRTDVNGKDFLGRDSLTHPEYKSGSASLSLRQTIFNLDGWARYRQGIAQSQASAAVFDARRNEMIMRVVGAYIDALFADDQLALVGAQRDTYVEQKKVNDRLLAKGEGTRTDQLETQARLDQAEAAVLEAKDNRVNALVTLAGIVGADVEYLDGLSGAFNVKTLPIAPFDEWKLTALANNAELQAQVYGLEVARQEIKKADAGNMPKMDFVASYSKNDSESITTFDQSNVIRSLGVQISIPIYSGGYVRANSHQASANYEKARADKDARTDRVLAELRKYHNAVISSASKVNALVKAEESGNLLIEATRQSIKGGVRINLDLLTAQAQLYATRRDLAQARYNYLIHYLRLRSTAGNLAVEDLRQVAGFFAGR